MGAETVWWSETARSYAHGWRALEAALVDGTWRSAMVEWLQVFDHVAYKAPDVVSVDVGLSRFVDVVVAIEKLDDAERALVAPLASRLRPMATDPHAQGKDQQLARLATWLAARAEPGDAALVLQVITSVSPPDAIESPALAPLVRWVFAEGAAELRVHQRTVGYERPGRAMPFVVGTTLLYQLARFADRHAPEKRVIAFRYLLASDRYDVPHDATPALWDLCERVLVDDALTPAIVIDVLRMAYAVRGDGGQRWAPFETITQWPRTRAALLDVLLAGALPFEYALEGARAAMKHLKAPVGAHTAPGAMEPLVMATHSLFAAGGGGVDVDGWVTLVAEPLARGLAANTARAQRRRELEFLASRTPAACLAGVQRAMPDVGEVARLGGTENAYPAAMAAIAMAASLSTSSAHRSVDLSEVRRHLDRVLHCAWLEPVCGIDVSHLLGRMSRVEFAELDRAVLVDGERLVLNEREVKSVLERFDPMMACIYGIHELVHVEQGFAGGDVVRTARSVGAETTVMQIDLAADHIATHILNAAIPEWSVRTLKGHTSRGIVGFPVGRFHTTASRHRKALRLASSRFDSAMREQGNASWTDPAFYWLDVAIGSREALAFRSASHLQLIGAATLTEPERELLMSCADAEGPDDFTMFKHLDQVAQRIAQVVAEKRR